MPVKRIGGSLTIVADDGTATGWEHVSVSYMDPGGRYSPPTLAQLEEARRIFWADGEVVLSVWSPAPEGPHHVTHLWRPLERPFTPPPGELFEFGRQEEPR